MRRFVNLTLGLVLALGPSASVAADDDVQVSKVTPCRPHAGIETGRWNGNSVT